MSGRLTPLVIVFALLAVVDFLAVPVGSWAIRAGRGAEWLWVMGTGAFLAQFAILPAWLVWGCRPLWQRVAIHCGTAAILLVAWTLGWLVVDAGSDILIWLFYFYEHVARVVVPAALLLPAISLAVEGPLWLTRVIFGWRLAPPGREPEPDRKLAIRDFLIGMSVVAMALAAVRASLAASEQNVPADAWTSIAIQLGCAALASALALPLLAWALLRLPDLRGGLGVVGVYGLATYCLLAIVGLILFRPARPLESLAYLFILQATFTALTGASFTLARRAGYRLQIGQPREAAT